MKLQCLDCKKQFLYAARKTVSQTSDSISSGTLESIETHVCPYCQSLNLDEVMEVLPIVSVKSVDLSEVDALLKDGYEVHELYAKTATLMKKEKKEG